MLGKKDVETFLLELKKFVPEDCLQVDYHKSATTIASILIREAPKSKLISIVEVRKEYPLLAIEYESLAILVTEVISALLITFGKYQLAPSFYHDEDTGVVSYDTEAMIDFFDRKFKSKDRHNKDDKKPTFH